MDEIKRDPWFRKGYKDVKFQESDDFDLFVEEGKDKPIDLNAFDIISFSSGLDLSALFHDHKCRALEEVERLMVEESPEKVMETVVAVAKAEEGSVKLRRKKEWGVEIEGQNGNFVVEVQVYRLTDRLAVVEVKRKTVELYNYICLWRDKIRPLILAQPELPVVGI